MRSAPLHCIHEFKMLTPPGPVRGEASNVLLQSVAECGSNRRCYEAGAAAAVHADDDGGRVGDGGDTVILVVVMARN